MANQSFFQLVPPANDIADETCACSDVSPAEQAAFEAECDAVFWALQNALDAYSKDHPALTFQVARHAAECLVDCLKHFEAEATSDA